LIKIALDPGWNRESPRPVPDLETTRAVVEEAHVHGLHVRAHLIQPPQMDLAIQAGVDVVLGGELVIGSSAVAASVESTPPLESSASLQQPS
jgi:imidazolonepropionase-like amidohydrolase